MKMNRRQLFFSTAKAVLAAAFGGPWLTGNAKAETGGAASPGPAEGEIQGVPGSPEATRAILGALRKRI
jgi:hypothetical protein